MRKKGGKEGGKEGNGEEQRRTQSLKTHSHTPARTLARVMKKKEGGSEEGGRGSEEGGRESEGGRKGKGKRREMDCQTQTHKEEPSSCFLGVVDLACFGLVFSSSLFAASCCFSCFFFSVFPPACAFGLVHTGRFCWRGNVLWLVFANAVPRFRPHGFMLSHTAFLCGFNSGDLAIWHLWQHVSKHPSEI